MLFFASATTILAFLTSTTLATKRGLIYIPPASGPSDDRIWTQPPSPLTWYYNYQSEPTPSLHSNPLHFVPMLWGAPPPHQPTAFLDAVTAQLARGANITHVLGFNEPDGPPSTGGSALTVEVAAEAWMANMEPLRRRGVKVGLPATTGAPGGRAWLERWLAACEGRCGYDFLTAHWYDNIEGLASHVGEKRQVFGAGMAVWVTEFAYAHQGLAATQEVFNKSLEYLDGSDFIERYAYFGAFRSGVSNVGPNGAMLTESGKLTDIGSWYLGGSATGNVPTSSGARANVFAGWSVVVVLVSAWGLP